MVNKGLCCICSSSAPVLPADISVTASPAPVLLWYPEVNQHYNLVVAGAEGLGVSPDAMGLLLWLEKNPIDVSNLQAFHQGIESAPISQLSKQFFKKRTFEVPDPEGKCILGSKFEGRGRPCARCRCVIHLATSSCCRACTLVPIMHPYIVTFWSREPNKPTVLSAPLSLHIGKEAVIREDIEQLLAQLAESCSVLVLAGARRTGKSVGCLHILLSARQKVGRQHNIVNE